MITQFFVSIPLPGFVAGVVPPQPGGEAPPGVGPFATQLLSWFVWGAGFAAVGALILIGIRMMVGMRNRSQMAADGLGSLPWVFGGLVLVSSASAIASAVLEGGG